MITPSEAQKIASLTKKSLVLSDVQRQLIVGTMLGDGTLEKNGRYHRLKVQQSVGQKDYVLWKYGILKNWVISEPHYQAVNQSLRFRTVTHPLLSKLREEFYSQSTKVVPKNIDEYIQEPLILAVWFMDDGNLIRRYGTIRGLNINSHSFSKDENELLVDKLKYFFGLSAAVEKNNGGYRIRINQSSHGFFRTIISSHTIASMQYKLG